MLKKRLIGVITVRDGLAVQSFAYSRHLPLGRPEILAENLDRWGTDEIVVLSIDRSRQSLGPDLALVRRLSGMGLSTPLTYGGGIHTADDAKAVVQSGADRICVDAVLRAAPDNVRAMSALVGAQAVVAVLPMEHGTHGPAWLDYLSGVATRVEAAQLALFTERVVSEVLLVDVPHEGHPNAFDERLIDGFPVADVPLIVFGGISEPPQLARCFDHPHVVAVGVGNFLAYREHAAQRLKAAARHVQLRPSVFSSL